MPHRVRQAVIRNSRLTARHADDTERNSAALPRKRYVPKSRAVVLTAHFTPTASPTGSSCQFPRARIAVPRPKTRSSCSLVCQHARNNASTVMNAAMLTISLGRDSHLGQPVAGCQHRDSDRTPAALPEVIAEDYSSGLLSRTFLTRTSQIATRSAQEVSGGVKKRRRCQQHRRPELCVYDGSPEPVQGLTG